MTEAQTPAEAIAKHNRTDCIKPNPPHGTAKRADEISRLQLTANMLKIHIKQILLHAEESQRMYEKLQEHIFDMEEGK